MRACRGKKQKHLPEAPVNSDEDVFSPLVSDIALPESSSVFDGIALDNGDSPTKIPRRPTQLRIAVRNCRKDEDKDGVAVLATLPVASASPEQYFETGTQVLEELQTSGALLNDFKNLYHALHAITIAAKIYEDEGRIDNAIMAWASLARIFQQLDMDAVAQIHRLQQQNSAVATATERQDPAQQNLRFEPRLPTLPCYRM